jgi:hypothetical protein
MEARSLVVGLMAAALVGGVATASNKWTATLEPSGDSGVRGTALVEQGDSVTHARVSVTGGKAGDELPWHVHAGVCPTPGAPVGGAAPYSSIRVGEGGRGEATATLPTRLAQTGQYSVNVHRSKSDMSSIACGTLKTEGGK